MEETPPLSAGPVPPLEYLLATKTPDLAHGIVAWRAWRIRKGRLRSALISEALWPEDKPLEAVCQHPNAPRMDCSCGIYAAKSPEQVSMLGDTYGKVLLWGKVIEHKDGYRAQYAYPLTLRSSNFRLLRRYSAEFEWRRPFDMLYKLSLAMLFTISMVVAGHVALVFMSGFSTIPTLSLAVSFAVCGWFLYKN